RTLGRRARPSPAALHRRAAEALCAGVRRRLLACRPRLRLHWARDRGLDPRRRPDRLRLARGLRRLLRRLQGLRARNARRTRAGSDLRALRVGLTRFNGAMALDVAAWEDLLAGSELAYLTEEPARAGRTAPLPGELHPKA